MLERPSTPLAVRLLVAALCGGALAGSALPAQADSTVTISQGVDPVTMDPLKRTITPTQNASMNMFDTLLRHDREGKIVPWLATSWKHVAPTVWEFKLRKGVTFWNGDPLTSADVKFTVEKIKDPAEGSEQGPRVNTIARVETPDAYTVRYVTFKPTAIVPGYPWTTSIVDAKYWKEHGNEYQAEHPMGSGAYVFQSWRKDEELDLNANPKWWHGKPPIDHAIFKPIPEAASRVAALRTGETDLITNVPPQYEAQISGGRNTKIESARSDRVLFIAFNTTKPGPQQNKLLRRAFNYAVDVPALIRTVLGGHGYPASTPVPPNFTGFSAKIPFYHHDLAKAKQLLAKAGYPDGKGLELVLNAPVGRYNRDKELAEAIAGQLSETGAKVTTKIQEWTTYVNQTSQRALTPLYMLGWGDNSYDADNTLTSLFESNARISTYANPAYDTLVDAARYEVDSGKRQALYDKALAILHDDAPWIFLFQYDDLYGTSKRLQWRARADESLAVDEMSLSN
jgi:peptide/nickel transport system substrate-binding protein